MRKRPEEVFGYPHTPTKAAVEAALKMDSQCLMGIHLSQPATPLAQAIKDFRRERVLFNEVPFIPDKADTDRNVGFALTLSEFLRRIRQIYPSVVDNGLVRKERGRSLGQFVEPSDDSNGDKHRQKDRESTESKHQLLDLDNMSSAELILQRSCRSSAGTDSFFMVQRLFAIEGTLVTQRSNILGFVPFVNGEPPVVIDVFLEDKEDFRRKWAMRKAVEGVLKDDKAVEEVGETTAKTTESAGSTGDTPIASVKADASGGSSTISCKCSSSGSRSGSSTPDVERGTTSESSAARPPGSSVTSSPHLVCDICISNSFAVYDAETVDLISGDPNTDPPPWLEVETIITDRCNFTTGQQHRVLEVQVYIPALNAYYPPLQAGAGV